MKILKLISRIQLTVAYILLIVGMALHSVFEKTAMVFHGQAYWLHFSACILILLAAKLEFFHDKINGSTKLALIKCLPSVVCIPLMFFILLDPFYVNVNIFTLPLFAYLTYRLLLSGIISNSLIVTIILFTFAAFIIVGMIISGIYHASFEQLNWDIRAGITAIVCSLIAFFSYTKEGAQFLGFLKKG